jgi:hypothetical protein
MPFFAEAAQELLDSGERTPQELLSLALAAVSGMTEPPKPRSLITMEEGATTVLLREGNAARNADDDADDEPFMRRYRPSISSARDVVRACVPPLVSVRFPRPIVRDGVTEKRNDYTPTRLRTPPAAALLADGGQSF